MDSYRLRAFLLLRRVIGVDEASGLAIRTCPLRQRWVAQVGGLLYRTSMVRYQLGSEEGERLTARRGHLHLLRSIPCMEVLILCPCSFVQFTQEPQDTMHTHTPSHHSASKTAQHPASPKRRQNPTLDRLMNPPGSRKILE